MLSNQNSLLSTNLKQVCDGNTFSVLNILSHAFNLDIIGQCSLHIEEMLKQIPHVYFCVIHPACFFSSVLRGKCRVCPVLFWERKKSKVHVCLSLSSKYFQLTDLTPASQWNATTCIFIIKLEIKWKTTWRLP